MIEYQLRCKHIQTAMGGDYIEPIMMCATCKHHFNVIAVECREWRFHCVSQTGNRQCGYSRWTGQDGEEAIRLAKVHHERTGHSTQEIDYIRFPSLVKTVRANLGPRIKTFIIRQTNKKAGGRRQDNMPQPTLPMSVPTSGEDKPPF